jgi:hypothetical protein
MRVDQTEGTRDIRDVGIVRLARGRLGPGRLGPGRLAEGEGFEPPVPLRVRLISSQVPSTTQPPFRDSVLMG